MANIIMLPHPRLSATNPQFSTTTNTVVDVSGVTKTTLSSPSHSQSTPGSPQQSQRARSRSQQLVADLQQPALLDLQHEYGVIREHISRKDADSGLPAIASVAVLRGCMADLKDIAKMDSEDWFQIVREKIDEELVRAGFAGLPIA